MAQKIKAVMMYEMMGRPKEHLKKSLEEFIDKIAEGKNIEITKKEIKEPVAVEMEKKLSQELFTTFAEIEFEFETLNQVFQVVMNTLPANIEILEPTEMRLKSFEASTILSEMAVKLHQYDEVAKVITMEQNMLVGKVKELQAKVKELGGDVKDSDKKEGNVEEEKVEVKKDKK